MIIDPRHLMQLTAIVNAGSYSEAAKRMGLTQPALSRNMRILEKTVGARVLERGRNGVTPTEVVFGTHTDLSGVAATYGISSSNGVLMKFDEVNAEGGIYGRKLKLIVEDAGYQVPKAVQACNKLIQRDKVFAFIAAIGTPPESPCSRSPVPWGWLVRRCASMPAPRRSRRGCLTVPGRACLIRTSHTWRDGSTRAARTPWPCGARSGSRAIRGRAGKCIASSLSAERGRSDQAASPAARGPVPRSGLGQKPHCRPHDSWRGCSCS